MRVGFLQDTPAGVPSGLPHPPIGCGQHLGPGGQAQPQGRQGGREDTVRDPPAQCS